MRCKIDSKYECRRHLQPQTEWYNPEHPCLGCPIFAKSNQHIFKNGGEIEMSDFMQKLHEKAQDQLESMPLSEVPNEAKLKLMNAKMKTDTRGNECVYLYLKTPNNLMITQKYPPSAFKVIEDAIQKAGGYEELSVGFHDWRKQEIARLQFARLLPLPKPKEKKEK